MHLEIKIWKELNQITVRSEASKSLFENNGFLSPVYILPRQRKLGCQWNIHLKVVPSMNVWLNKIFQEGYFCKNIEKHRCNFALWKQPFIEYNITSPSFFVSCSY